MYQPLLYSVQYLIKINTDPRVYHLAKVLGNRRNDVERKQHARPRPNVTTNPVILCKIGVYHHG
jgi:hypothetical protein